MMIVGPTTHVRGGRPSGSSVIAAATAPAPCSSPRHHPPPCCRRRGRATLLAVAAASSSSSSFPSSPPPPNNRATVVEYLLLVNVRPGLDPDEVHEALETVWSLQYMVPGAGVICASAGRVFAGGGGGGGGEADDDARLLLGSGPFTHVIHFRLANRPALERFVGHPLFARTVEDALGPLSGGGDGEPPPVPSPYHAELVFEGCVDRALEPMFRRGPDYEPGGVEQLWLLSGAESTTAGEEEQPTGAAAFLARLGELAESSAAGAVQATFGPVLAASPPSPEITHVLMARFTALGQAAAFAALPPCAAISGGGGGGGGGGDDDGGPGASSAPPPPRAAALPLLARRRLLIRAGKLEEDDDG